MSAMKSGCGDHCAFERVAEAEFRGLRGDIREIRDRMLRLEQALGRGVLLPAATSAGLQLSHLFAGILMIEVVFNYPGMGTLLHRALAARDYPLLQGILLLGSVTVLTMNLLIDLVYPILDPRVKPVCISDTEKN